MVWFGFCGSGVDIMSIRFELGVMKQISVRKRGLWVGINTRLVMVIWA